MLQFCCFPFFSAMFISIMEKGTANAEAKILRLVTAYDSIGFKVMP